MLSTRTSLFDDVVHGEEGVDERDDEGDDSREESGEGSKHLSISFVLHSLAEGVGHIETETGAFFLGD